MSVLFLVSTVACSTSHLSVKSDPVQAEVFVENPKTGVKKSLGFTPLDVPMGQVKDAVGDSVGAGDFFTLILEKKGFISQQFKVPATRFGTLMTEVTAPLKQGDDVQQAHLADDILDHLFTAQKFALAKEFERANTEIDHVLAVSPEFPRALSMRGSIYFVQKKYDESLKWYEQALKADPKMEEAVKMIARIKAAQGSKP